MNELLELLEYRRRVADLYAHVRRLLPDAAAAHEAWRAGRDELFARHPQSALDEGQREAFRGLRYYRYDPAFAFVAEVEPAEAERLEIPNSSGGVTAFHRCGVARLPFGTLDVYWLDAYGGGLFLPFRDATAGDTTYGGGRYLLDTAKGADLGGSGATLVCDFNFAYHPSCHYNARWSCPLAPPGNRVDARVEAGEQRYP